MRVCQFRHDGKWTSIVAAPSWPPDQEGLRSYSTTGKDAVKRYSSLAFIVIFAFKTFDTGQPFSAASAYF